MGKLAIFAEKCGTFSLVQAIELENSMVILNRRDFVRAGAGVFAIGAVGAQRHPARATQVPLTQAVATGMYEMSGVHLADDGLYVAGRPFAKVKPSISKFDRASHELVWSVEQYTFSRLGFGPSGELLVFHEDSSLAALRSEDGSEIWRGPVEDPSGRSRSAIGFGGGCIVYRTWTDYGYRIFLLSIADGKPAFPDSPVYGIEIKDALVSGTNLILLDETGDYAIFNLSSGEIHGPIDTALSPADDPTGPRLTENEERSDAHLVGVFDSVLVMQMWLDSDFYLFGVDIDTGLELWRHLTMISSDTARIQSTLAGDGWVTSTRRSSSAAFNDFWSYDPVTGAELWTATLQSEAGESLSLNGQWWGSLTSICIGMSAEDGATSRALVYDGRTGSKREVITDGIIPDLRGLRGITDEFVVGLAQDASESSKDRSYYVMLYSLPPATSHEGTEGAFVEFVISGSGMAPTYQDGEIVMIEQNPYAARTPARGDIVVFDPPVATSSPYVKRIIGLPNETIEIDDSTIFADATAIVEPYLPSHGGNCNGPHGACPSTIAVPSDSVYVVGDNRSNSTDSRMFGPIAIESIIGLVQTP